jgi:UDP-glucuronate 4-epimerase
MADSLSSCSPSCYLVTGAAGFIGAEVCAQLLAAGHQVVGVDNLNDYYDTRLKDWRLAQLFGREFNLGADPHRSAWATDDAPARNATGTFTFHWLDIENLPALEALFTAHRFSAVINLAARAGVRYSLVNPHVYLSTNAQGTLNLLECQCRHGVKKLVLASTSSLYAGCPMPFTEDQPVNQPLSPYAASKKAAEVMAYSYHHLYGLDVSVVRYFTVFGPAGRPDMAPFRFVKWIAEGTPITLYGDGSQTRDFTYVADIARGTILATRPLGYEVINLGGGNEPVSLTTVIGWLEAGLGRPAVIDRQDFQAVDMRETSADITKAGRLLGWHPEIRPEEGFRRTVAWYQANRDWLSTVQV